MRSTSEEPAARATVGTATVALRDMKLRSDSECDTLWVPTEPGGEFALRIECALLGQEAAGWRRMQALASRAEDPLQSS